MKNFPIITYIEVQREQEASSEARVLSGSKVAMAAEEGMARREGWG